MLPTFSRRTFLASGVAASLIGMDALATPQAPAHPYKAFGVGMYTVRAAVAADASGTFKKIKALGYDQIEPFTFAGKTPKAYRALAQDAGLDVPSCLLQDDDWYSDVHRTLDDIASVGATYAVLPWLNPARRADAKREPRRFADTLNAWGALAKARGLVMAYHNHAFEFEKLGNEGALFDQLIKHTDPSLVVFELDTYWAKRGGHDALTILKNHGSRIRLLHLKDMDANGKMAPVGQGVFDFKAILQAAHSAGVTHIFAEHDNPADPFESLAQSARYLRGV